MKRKGIKILSVALISALICSAAANASSVKSYEVEEKTVAEGTTATVTSTEGLPAKDETVYIIAKSNGEVKNIIVSDWLKNTDSYTIIEDNTILQDVINVKGDESFTQSGENIVWSANGNDIYYRGTTDKEPPVSISLSFKLDGKEIAASELAGKSGEVTIRIDYENSAYTNIGDEQIAVPFMMLTGMVLENDNFRNIEVTNGKLINDGDRSIIVGAALPGLDFGTDIIEIPDYIEITADTTDFKLGGTVTVATNEIFKELEIDSEDNLDSLNEDFKKLSDSMEKLCDGSSELYDGIEMLLEKSDTLVSGVEQLYKGAKEIDTGVFALSKGATELDLGTKQLFEGLSALSENSDALRAGAKQIFETLLSQAYVQLTEAGISVDELTINNYSTTLESVLQSLDEDTVYNLAYQTAKAQVEEAVNAQADYIKSQVTLGVKQKVTEAVLSAAGMNMSAEEYEAAVEAGAVSQEIQGQITAAVEAQMNSDEVQVTIDDTTDEQISALVEENMKSDEVVSQIQAAVNKAAEGAKTITALKAQLDSLNEFYNGVIAYTDGVDFATEGAESVYEGVDALNKGISDLKEGTGTLFDGIGQLKDNSGLLVDGVKQLSEGAKILTEGINEFNKEGIQKLIDSVDGEIGNLTEKIDNIRYAANSYSNFSGISDNTEGSVKFIYKTQPIE